MGALARLLITSALVVLGLILAVPSASADEPGETDVGYLLVQQALAHLAHDSTAETFEAALEKVEDALETDDQKGVDISTLERAVDALEAEDIEGARGLLQESIAEALHNRPSATGMESGTTIVRPELPGRSELAGQDWGFLVAAAAALILGAWLSFRFRPGDSVRVLRTRLALADGSTRREAGS
jgi:hypothetical protein